MGWCPCRPWVNTAYSPPPRNALVNDIHPLDDGPLAGFSNPFCTPTHSFQIPMQHHLLNFSGLKYELVTLPEDSDAISKSVITNSSTMLSGLSASAMYEHFHSLN